MSDPRKAYIPDRLATLKDVSAKASGELAETSFGWDAVLEAMLQAAKRGQTCALLEPPYPADWRHTDVWKNTTAALKEQGFGVEDIERPSREPWQRSWAMLVRWQE